MASSDDVPITRLTEFHSYADGVRWRVVPAGVEIEGSGVERTRGVPSTVTQVWEIYSSHINRAARARGVACALILATICAESGGKADAVRLERGYVSDERTSNKVRVGLMQTFISTACDMLGYVVDRKWLLDPANSIEAGTAYIARQAALTHLDPPLVATAYSAGRLAYDSGERNRWKLRQPHPGTGEYCDRFVHFFNDALFVLALHDIRPAVGIEGLLGLRAQ